MTATRPGVTVVGDALLDVDLEGSVSRICPDAPVPVFDEGPATQRPGGAALAATLASRAGAEVTFVTALGDDRAGEALGRLLADEGIAVVDLGLGGATAEKIRLRADGHSVLRLDRGGPSGVRGEGLDRARAALRAASAVLVADYGRGVAAVDPLREELAARRAPIVWDPHPRGAAVVTGATVVTPSQAELLHAVPDADANHGLAGTVERAATLVRRWGVGAAAVTMGAEGALLARAEGAPLVVPARRIAAGDPCGAGDAFAATLATVLASGDVLSGAVERATAAATDFVEAGGAAAVASPGGHADAALGLDLDFVAGPVTDAAPAYVVATGGCFDLLHAGHVSLLQAAACLGDRLVVLVNSDRSVARLKGPDRPIQTEDDRRAVLLALACVDDVVIFDEDTPNAALEKLRPQLFVKGGDYAGVPLPEAEVLGRWGGQVAIVPYLDGRSTTRLVKEARRGA